MVTNDNPFTESNELIAKLLKENKLEVMHLEMYLDTQNIVCVEKQLMRQCAIRILL